MLTLDHALERAERHQRQAVRDAAAFGRALGEPVGFLRRPGPAGAEFEAVVLASARTCAVVDAEGRLRYVAGTRSPDPWHRTSARRVAQPPRTGARRIAERALATAGRRR